MHTLEPFALGELLPAWLEPPVRLHAYGAALGDEQVPGRKLLHPPQPRSAGHVLEREVRVERGRIDLASQLRQLEQGFQLGGESDRAVRQLGPKERLLPDPVAGEHEPLATRIPEGDREHAREPSDELRAALLVEVRDHRGVAGAAHLMAGQLRPQLAEVVELAVEDGDDVARLVRDGLAAGDEVDDLQAPVAEHAAPERVHRALVGPPVDEGRVHPLDERRVRPARRRDQPADPAHAREPSRPGGHCRVM